MPPLSYKRTYNTATMVSRIAAQYQADDVKPVASVNMQKSLLVKSACTFENIDFQVAPSVRDRVSTDMTVINRQGPGYRLRLLFASLKQGPTFSSLAPLLALLCVSFESLATSIVGPRPGLDFMQTRATQASKERRLFCLVV